MSKNFFEKIVTDFEVLTNEAGRFLDLSADTVNDFFMNSIGIATSSLDNILENVKSMIDWQKDGNNILDMLLKEQENSIIRDYITYIHNNPILVSDIGEVMHDIYTMSLDIDSKLKLENNKKYSCIVSADPGNYLSLSNVKDKYNEKPSAGSDADIFEDLTYSNAGYFYKDSDPINAPPTGNLNNIKTFNLLGDTIAQEYVYVIDEKNNSKLSVNFYLVEDESYLRGKLFRKSCSEDEYYDFYYSTSGELYKKVNPYKYRYDGVNLVEIAQKDIGKVLYEVLGNKYIASSTESPTDFAWEVAAKKHLEADKENNRVTLTLTVETEEERSSTIYDWQPSTGNGEFEKNIFTTDNQYIIFESSEERDGSVNNFTYFIMDNPELSECITDFDNETITIEFRAKDESNPELEKITESWMLLTDYTNGSNKKYFYKKIGSTFTSADTYMEKQFITEVNKKKLYIQTENKIDDGETDLSILNILFPNPDPGGCSITIFDDANNRSVCKIKNSVSPEKINTGGIESTVDLYGVDKILIEKIQVEDTTGVISTIKTISEDETFGKVMDILDDNLFELTARGIKALGKLIFKNDDGNYIERDIYYFERIPYIYNEEKDKWYIYDSINKYYFPEEPYFPLMNWTDPSYRSFGNLYEYLKVSENRMNKHDHLEDAEFLMFNNTIRDYLIKPVRSYRYLNKKATGAVTTNYYSDESKISGDFRSIIDTIPRPDVKTSLFKSLVSQLIPNSIHENFSNTRTPNIDNLVGVGTKLTFFGDDRDILIRETLNGTISSLTIWEIDYYLEKFINLTVINTFNKYIRCNKIEVKTLEDAIIRMKNALSLSTILSVSADLSKKIDKAQGELEEKKVNLFHNVSNAEKIASKVLEEAKIGLRPGDIYVTLRDLLDFLPSDANSIKNIEEIKFLVFIYTLLEFFRASNKIKNNIKELITPFYNDANNFRVFYSSLVNKINKDHPKFIAIKNFNIETTEGGSNGTIIT